MEESPKEGKARNHLALPGPTSTQAALSTCRRAGRHYSQLKEATPLLSKRERSSRASFGHPEQQRQQEEPFTRLRHRGHVWKQQYVGEKSPCLQICGVTVIDHGNLGAIRNITACRKEG